MGYTFFRKAWLACAVILLLGNTYSYSSQKTDSLYKELANKKLPDTTRVNIYSSLAWEYKNRLTNIDSIIHYANKGLALSNAINYEHGKALCYMHLGVAHMMRHEYLPSLHNLNASTDGLRAAGDKKNLNEALHTVGLIYNLQARYDSARRYFLLSKALAVELNNKSRMARAYLYLGGLENDMGNFSGSLQNYLQALTLYEQTRNNDNVTSCYTNIALLYAQLKDFKKAREFVAKSITAIEAFHNPAEMIFNLSNIGIVYSMMGEHERALNLFNRGLAIADSTENVYWISVLLTDIAEVYTNTGRLEEAKGIFRQMLERYKDINDITIVASAHSGIGKILYDQGKKSEGLAHILQAFRIARDNKTNLIAMETAKDLTEIYEKEADLKNALEYAHIYHAYKDSIYNENNDKKVQQLQFDYELENKQRQIEQLNKNKEIETAEASKQQVIKWAFVAATAMLMVIIMLMYSNRLYEKKRKQEILKQKEEIELQAAKLEELNGFKDKTFSVLSHDLRGPVNSISTAIQMLNNKDITAEEYADMKPEINNQLNSLNLLLDNVLLWAKSHIEDGRAVHPAPTSIYDLVSQNVALLAEAADRKKLVLRNKVEGPAVAYCDAGQMDIVLRNLIMNAIKYTGSGGTITIDSETAGDSIKVSVADTGVGMASAQVERLFAPKTGRNTYGTAGERGIGLGLLLCNEFVKVNNGSISVESEVGKGSKFTVTLPRT